MSSEPILGYKRSAPDAPDTSDDDGSQPERGKEAEAAGPKRRWSKKRRLSRLVLAQLSLRAGSGMETRKWVRNVGFATRAMLGGARKQDRVCAVREVGREARSLKRRERKIPSTSRVASKAKAKRRLWRLESVPRPRKATRSKSSRMETKWAVVGQAAKL